MGAIDLMLADGVLVASLQPTRGHTAHPAYALLGSLHATGFKMHPGMYPKSTLWE